MIFICITVNRRNSFVSAKLQNSQKLFCNGYKDFLSKLIFYCIIVGGKSIIAMEINKCKQVDMFSILYEFIVEK